MFKVLLQPANDFPVAELTKMSDDREIELDAIPGIGMRLFFQDKIYTVRDVIMNCPGTVVYITPFISEIQRLQKRANVLKTWFPIKF